MPCNLILRLTLRAFLCMALVGCDRATSTSKEPLRQRGYVWQRNWTGAVVEAVAETETRMDGVVILGAEIDAKALSTIKSSIDWEKLKDMKKPLAIALRIAPFSGPFAA